MKIGYMTPNQTKTVKSKNGKHNKIASSTSSIFSQTSKQAERNFNPKPPKNER